MLKKANEGSLFLGMEKFFVIKELSHQAFVETIHDFVSEGRLLRHERSKHKSTTWHHIVLPCDMFIYCWL
jgi:hypothetical protein